MAFSRIDTLLPLEEYARIMSISGWHFNSVEYPQRPARGSCDLCWMQSGYASDPNRIVGRDEVAQAIAEAESMIAMTCKFWPAPKWFCGDRGPLIKWPDPSRGLTVWDPALKTKWGYLIEAGTETWDQLNAVPVVPIYTDTNGDGVTDWATVTFNLYLEDLEECEAVITPAGYLPENGFKIEPLQVAISGGVLTVAGPKWMFVLPSLLLTTECANMDSALEADFVTGVDIYRHSNTPYPAARVIWSPDPCDTLPCTDKWQDACIVVQNSRVGMFSVTPGAYSQVAGTWSATTWAYCTSPRGVALWYRAGYEDPTCDSCDYMGPALKRAIVSLANCYMSDPPCGCDETMARWRADNEMQKMDTYNVAMAASHFGTSKRGAVYAYSVISRLPQMGRGG